MNKSHFFSLWFIQFSFSQQNLFLNWPPILLYMIYFPVNLNLVLSNLVYIFGEGNGTPLQYSCLKNPMDGGAWKAAVHGVAEGRTWLNDFTFIFHFHALEKEMATHSSVLAWRIPGTGEPGGLPSMGSHRVRHDWSNLAAAAVAVYIFNLWLNSGLIHLI